MARIAFPNENVKKAFLKLNSGPHENRKLYNFLLRAFEDLEKDPNCGVQMPNKLIPKHYFQRYNINNLWKYDLPNGWRLIYSLKKDEVEIIAIILEWFDHKNYERRMGY